MFEMEYAVQIDELTKRFSNKKHGIKALFERGPRSPIIAVDNLTLERVLGKSNFLFNRREHREDAEFAEFLL